MRPEFGCRIHDAGLRDGDAATVGRIARDVRRSLRALGAADRRRRRRGVRRSPDPATLYIDIRYSVGSTNDPRNLVFPFYVIPSEE